MPQWNTGDYKAAEQFGFWREVLCEAFIALNSTCEDADGFRAEVVANRVDGINVCRLITDEHNILRTRREISRMPKDCFFVNMQIDGDVHVRHQGKEVQIGPEQFYVVDAAEPYELAYRRPGGNVRTFSFRIPKPHLAPLLSDTSDAMGVRVSRDTAIGALAVDFLKNVAMQSDAIPATAQPAMARMAADLIALSLNPHRDHSAALAQSKRKARLDSILTFIDRNCARELSVDLVCRRFNISPRSLHRLFDEEGLTFAREITVQRLNKSVEAMRAYPDASIATIAFASGFGDLSSFNRQFRKQFGLAPREYRSRLIADGSDADRS
jgi:AraC family transcriptional regulator, positive regulator of tynA and feaB